MNITDKPGTALSVPTADSPTLTRVEAEHLARYEQIITAGKESYLKVGEALLEICDQRLYRRQYQTFVEYCVNKWKFTARQANRLMEASQVVQNLKSDQLVSSVPVAIPQNESQARKLAALTPSEQIQAARVVASNAAKPTAKDFAEAAEEVAEVKPRITVAGQSGSTKTTTGKASLESLIELIDEVQTMVRVDRPKELVLGKLKVAADLATRINNGGGK